MKMVIIITNDYCLFVYNQLQVDYSVDGKVVITQLLLIQLPSLLLDKRDREEEREREREREENQDNQLILIYDH